MDPKSEAKPQQVKSRRAQDFARSVLVAGVSDRWKRNCFAAGSRFVGGFFIRKAPVIVMTKKIPLRITQEVRHPKCGNSTRLANVPKMADPPPISRERQADRQTHPVRKPFRHDGDNGPVTESVPDATQNAVEKIEEVQTGRVRKKEKTQRDQYASGRRKSKRARSGPEAFRREAARPQTLPRRE